MPWISKYPDVIEHYRAFIQRYGYRPSIVQVARRMKIDYQTAYRHINTGLANGDLPPHTAHPTRRQRDVYLYYCDYIREFSMSPTMTEVADGIGTHRTFVYRCVQELVEMGYLDYDMNRYRRAIILPDSDERSAA